MAYQINVNEEYNFEFEKENLKGIDIQPLGNGRFHILKNNQSFEGEVVSTDFLKKSLVLLVNGNTYTVQIADEYDALVKKLGLSVGTGQVVKDIKAPMPGLVLDVLVETGQTVQKGDGLLILEAMKMENVIKAQGDGIVKTIQVEKSQTVDKGAILIEMD